MDIRHHYSSLSLFGSPQHIFKVINKYGLDIRNNGHCEHVIRIGSSTDKIKDCLSILVSNKENTKYVQKQGDCKAASKDFIPRNYKKFE